MAPDLCADVAALINPLPLEAGAQNEDDDGAQAAAGQVMQEREETAEALRASWEYGDCDPLLSTLQGLRTRRLELEAQMRLLIAYGRQFSHPPPYKLPDPPAA